MYCNLYFYTPVSKKIELKHKEIFVYKVSELHCSILQMYMFCVSLFVFLIVFLYIS